MQVSFESYRNTNDAAREGPLDFSFCLPYNRVPSSIP